MTELDVYIDAKFQALTFLVNEKGTSVVQHPSRTATLNYALIGLPRCEYFEKALAKKAKKPVENHTIYQVTLPDGNSFAVFFRDRSTFFGFGVREENC